jgi:hypothetical protein
MEERRKPYKPDAKRVDENDYARAGGDTVCSRCGFAYYDHAPVVGFPWVQRLCDGRFVKL